jgi:L-aspartate oxidase
MDIDTIEFRNLIETATLVVACAERRHESRGLHSTIDVPHKDNERFLRDTMIADTGHEKA